MSGVIDETFPRETLDEIQGALTAIDLSGVTRINSYGVRNWVDAIGEVEAGFIGVLNCRPALVDQMNMVQGFLGKAQLITFFLPYACTVCSQTFEVLTDLRRNRTDLAQGIVPDATCTACGAAAEFDGIVESYLSFVQSHRTVPPPDGFDDLAAGRITTTPSPSLKFTKVVSGKWTGIWANGMLDGRKHFKRLDEGIDGQLYLSLGGVSSTTEDGSARLFEFVACLKVPVVLDEVPLEVAAKLVDNSAAHNKCHVYRVLAPYSCEAHGRVELAVKPTEMLGVELACPTCSIQVVPLFDRGMVERALALQMTSPDGDLNALLAARSRQDSSQGAPPPHKVLSPGALVLGRFRLLHLLGIGGMSEVYLARQGSLGGFEKQVVVKHILPHLAKDAHFVEMFLAEARVAARINHPNVAQVLDVAKDEGSHFIIMEYVDGGDLSSLLKRAMKGEAPCPLSVACRIIAGVARGLEAAHQQTDNNGNPTPVIHRDVSPHNVLVGRNGVVKLSDFGIAKAYDSLSLTPTSAVKGKTAYLAPELIRAGSKHGSTPKVDIFAAGLVLYAALVGRNPYSRASELETLSALTSGSLDPPSRNRPEIPPVLDAIVRKAVDPDPTQRYDTAGELAAALEAVVANGGVPDGGTVGAWLRKIDAVSPPRVLAEAKTPTENEGPTQGLSRMGKT